jgi:hypothetical protein
MPLAAQAQDAYPAKPVRIIVPYAAGGVADALPRIVGEKLAAKWKQTVVVDNKPGASGNIGMEEGARAEPDGYTLLLAAAGNMTVNPTLFRNLRFDTYKDLAPVTLLAASPNVLVVHPSVPVKTFKELVAYAKQNPGKLNFASPATAAAPPRRRTAEHRGRRPDRAHPVQGHRAGGQRPARRQRADDVRRHLDRAAAHQGRQADRARDREPAPLAAAARRADRRRGRPARVRRDLVVRHRRARRHAAPIIQKLQRDIAEALQGEEVHAKLAGLGLEPVGNTPDAFDAMIKAESRKWTEIVRKANIKPPQ